MECPNCESKINKNERCSECDHLDGDNYCNCDFCYKDNEERNLKQFLEQLSEDMS